MWKLRQHVPLQTDGTGWEVAVHPDLRQTTPLPSSSSFSEGSEQNLKRVRAGEISSLSVDQKAPQRPPSFALPAARFFSKVGEKTADS